MAPPAPPVAASRGSVVLPGGRKLAYATYGAPLESAKKKVAYFHGFPCSGTEAGLLDSDARELGLAIVGVDRPGGGESSPNPSGTFLSLAQDVGHLLDSLSVPSVVAFGASGGSPFATACALAMPDRVEALVLVVPLAPLHGQPELAADMAARGREMLLGPRTHPWGTWLRLQAARLIQQVPHGNLLLRMNGFAAVDLAATSEFPQQAATLRAAVREGLSQGVAGATRDLELYSCEPSGLDLGAVRCPTHVWAGAEDVTTPLAMAKWYGSGIPGVQLHVLEGEGHLSLGFRRNRDILSALL